jgi:hypothetical protein
MRRLFPTVDLKGQGFGKKRRYCRLLEALSDHGWCRLSEPLTPATSRIRMTKQFFTRDVKMEKPDTFERPRPTGPSERKAAANTNPSSPEVVKPTTQAVARKAHREDEVVTAHVILMPGIYQQHFWE